MQRNDILVLKLRSATAYVETILELYQSKEDPLLLAQQLKSVSGLLHEIRRELLTQELTAILRNEALPVATRNEKVVKIFQSLA
jgi:DNA-binding FrmR family transcriptional regulator